MATPPTKKSSAIEDVLNAKPAGEAAAAESTPKKPRGKKIKRTVLKARACIACGENNTIVTITDPAGSVLAWASSGSAGFKGSRKSTPYAAKVAAEKAMSLVESYGIQSLSIEVKGIGPGREQAIRGLQVSGVSFESIMDTTPIAHGGCRAKKPRRV